MSLGQRDDRASQPEQGPLAGLLGTVGAFVAGIVLPVALYLVLVGVPVALAPGIGFLASLLGLPELVGLSLWYLVIGAVGGLMRREASVVYGGAVIIVIAGQAEFLLVWPWFLFGVAGWIAMAALARVLDRVSEPG